VRRTVLFVLIFAFLSAFFLLIYLSDLEIKYKIMAEPVKTVFLQRKEFLKESHTAIYAF
jgi:hypothetical protein